MTSCIYCRKIKLFTDEHVLTRAFAGQGENWTLPDTVCGDCNSAFSLCERAWTSAPGEAMARIFHGPAGRKRKGRSYRVHPAEHVYMIRDDDPIAYEGEILDGLEPRVRPQVIWTGTELLAVAPDAEGALRLQVALDSVVHQRELTAYKCPSAIRTAPFLIAKLGSSRGQRSPCIIGYEWRDKPASIWLDRFPARPSRQPFYCRGSVDQDDRLRIRAENIETAVTFLRDIQNQRSARSGTISFPVGYKVHVEHLHDSEKMNRAIAKTAFNLGIKLLGRKMMSHGGFDYCRIYCWSGEVNEDRHPIVGYIVDDEDIARLPEMIRVRNKNHHVLLLASNGQRVVCLLRLYGGPVLRVHLGAVPLDIFEKYTVVDYAGRGMKLL